MDGHALLWVLIAIIGVLLIVSATGTIVGSDRWGFAHWRGRWRFLAIESMVFVGLLFLQLR